MSGSGRRERLPDDEPCVGEAIGEILPLADRARIKVSAAEDLEGRQRLDRRGDLGEIIGGIAVRQVASQTERDLGLDQRTGKRGERQRDAARMDLVREDRRVERRFIGTACADLVAAHLTETGDHF